MSCDPTFCPGVYTVELVIGLLLALFALWFFLRTRTAASVLVNLMWPRWRLPKFRRLSRAGRILSLIAAECLILPGLVVPALEHLVSRSPHLVSSLEFLRAVSFLSAIVLVIFVVSDTELTREKDKDKDKQ